MTSERKCNRPRRFAPAVENMGGHPSSPPSVGVSAALPDAAVRSHSTMLAAAAAAANPQSQHKPKMSSWREDGSHYEELSLSINI